MSSRMLAFYASFQARLLSGRRHIHGFAKTRRKLPFFILSIIVTLCDNETRMNCALLNREAYTYLRHCLYRNLVISSRAQLGLFQSWILEQIRRGKAKDTLRFVQTFQYTPVIETQTSAGRNVLRQLQRIPGIGENGKHLFPNLEKASLSLFVNNGAFNLTDPDNKGQNSFLSQVRMLSLHYLACHSAGAHRLPLKYLGLANITSIQVRPPIGTGPCPNIIPLLQDAYHLQWIRVDLQDHLDFWNQSSGTSRRPMHVGSYAQDVLGMIHDFMKSSATSSSSLRTLIFKIRRDQAYFQEYIKLVLQDHSDVTQDNCSRVQWEINDSAPSAPVLSAVQANGMDDHARASAEARSRCVLM